MQLKPPTLGGCPLGSWDQTWRAPAHSLTEGKSAQASLPGPGSAENRSGCLSSHVTAHIKGSSGSTAFKLSTPVCCRPLLPGVCQAHLAPSPALRAACLMPTAFPELETVPPFSLYNLWLTGPSLFPYPSQSLEPSLMGRSACSSC